MAASGLKFRTAGPGLCLVVDTPYALYRSQEMREGPRGGQYDMWELTVWTKEGWEATNEPGWRTLGAAKAFLRSNPEKVAVGRKAAPEQKSEAQA